MPEYQNIMVKMLVKDKFPYGDYGVLGPKDLATAISRLNQFVFVGLNEMCGKKKQRSTRAQTTPTQS